MMHGARSSFVFAAAVAAVACAREPAGVPATSGAGAPAADAGRIHFTDVSARTGIDMTTTCGRVPSTQLLEVKGVGLAVLDYDSDGDLDVFVPNAAYLDAPTAGPGARLYRNEGALRFVDVTRAAGIDFTGWGQGVAVGDFDGDGHDDLFVACFGSDVLLRNRGDGTFEDATARARLGDPRWGTGAAFGDLDGDLDLDLYVAHYLEFDPAAPPAPDVFRGSAVFGGPIGLVPTADVVYENLGDGTFRDASESSGILAAAAGYGLGVAILDFDGDGRQDVFVGNDSMPNNLFRNEGDSRFRDVALRSGLAYNGDGAAQATMGIAIADVNGDLAPDVFTTNFAGDTNTLHASVEGAFAFDDRTRQYNLGQVSRSFLGWAAAFHDLDHDGDEDLLAFNGHVYPQATFESMDSAFRQTPLLFERAGARFERVLAERAGAWLDEPRCDRSAAFGDLDRDGDVDVVVAGVNETVRVLENDGARGHWIVVELADRRPESKNRRGLGARVVLESGGSQQVRWIFGGGSYQSASEQVAHFGLADGAPVALEIRWPDGSIQVLSAIAPDRRLVVEHP